MLLGQCRMVGMVKIYLEMTLKPCPTVKPSILPGPARPITAAIQLISLHNPTTISIPSKHHLHLHTNTTLHSIDESTDRVADYERDINSVFISFIYYSEALYEEILNSFFTDFD
ncbi:unnamed protein product [Lactuca saligna]|uniref:Uncharacterized protein n=1 Tax=Lactuca saligna TaxID=75948 RepID=A0AA36DZE1_LACSI|nr:unnamed protein product [Lactuca saligna]